MFEGESHFYTMNFPLLIAYRYLKAKKSHNLINIISLIAVAGVTFGTMALITALSAFNGLEKLVLSLYDSFDPDLKIKPMAGKYFDPAEIPIGEICKKKGVSFYVEALEENVLIRYKEKHHIAVIKGVSGEFMRRTAITDRLVAGEFSLYRNGQPSAIIGYDVADKLSLRLDDIFNPCTFYVPSGKQEAITQLSPENSFNAMPIIAGGIFSIQQDFDSRYAIVPVEFARDLLGLPGKVSAIEIFFDTVLTRTESAALVAEIKKMIPGKYIALDRSEQHALLYKILKSEKWGVFLIVTLILIIAVFNITGSVTMLIFDKKNDIAVLHALGADHKTTRMIFMMEGMIVSLIGNVSGLVMGAALCIIQTRYKLLTFQENIIIDAYPVSMEATDFFYVFLTVTVIGFLSAYIPVKQITSQYALMRTE